jgi:hypothetical protein
VCCCNSCHGNAVNGFGALCLLYIRWFVGDHLLLMNVGPYGIKPMSICVN